MILEFADKNFVNVDSIQALRWLSVDHIEFGLMVVGGQKLTIQSRKDYDVLVKAFKWLHEGGALYKHDHKKFKGED
jgi:hypothetical protein